MSDIRFKTYVRMHLDTYQEFSKGCSRVYASFTWLKLLAILWLIGAIYTMRLTGDATGILALAAITLIVYVVKFLTSRGGSVQYRQMLAQNRDKPVYYTAEIDLDGIHVVNVDNGNQSEYALAQVIRILETEHLLILEMKPKLGFTVDKTTLTGGSREEFINFLRANCPNLKRKRVRKARGWSILTAVFLLLLILHLPMALGTLRQDSQWLPHDNPIAQGMSFSDCADTLGQLGFEVDDSLISELEAAYEPLPPEVIGMDNMTTLLSVLGMGEYDYDTWEWTPAANKVYSFDMEVFDVGNMYTTFLRGVSAIGEGELEFTNIVEDLSGVNIEDGSGSRVTHFDWNGQSYTLKTTEMADWFDPEAANALSKIIADQGGEKQLYFANDGYQMCFVFYCDKLWAREFSNQTGITLYGSL